MGTFKTGIGLKTTGMALNDLGFFFPPHPTNNRKNKSKKIRTFSMFFKKIPRRQELIPAVPSCGRWERVGPPGAVRLSAPVHAILGSLWVSHGSQPLVLGRLELIWGLQHAVPGKERSGSGSPFIPGADLPIPKAPQHPRSKHVPHTGAGGFLL